LKQTITKRSGSQEVFQSSKILNSMRNAGVGREAAEAVAAGIVYHEGITTAEVRNRVIGGIKNREPQSAQRYESHPRKSHQA
jgi:transcriptional regulator NrdR family protein